MTKSNTPAVSVVIASRRGGQWLDEALMSALGQTVPDLEVVVVDDGVAGGLGHLSHLDPRVRVVRGLGRGLALARNVGNVAARGTYIAVLDDDDVWLPAKLERQLDLLGKRPDAAMCHTQFEVIGADGELVYPGWAGPVASDGLFTGAVSVAHSTTLWHRERLLAVGGYDPTAQPAADLDLILRLSRQWPICFEPTVLMQYRAHDQNVSQNYRCQYQAARAVYEYHLLGARRRGEQRALGRLGAAPALKLLGQRYVEANQYRLIEDLQRRRLGPALAHLAWTARVAPLFTARVQGLLAVSIIGGRIKTILSRRGPKPAEA
ncbi:MAG: glycosyltransferase family 2 protein [Acidimicrobiales bacterium]